MFTMKLINGLLLPPQKKSELVRAMFRMLGRKYLFTSGTSGSAIQHPGVPPLCHMYLVRRDIKRLRQHGVRICSLLKDRSGSPGQVLYWVFISLRSKGLHIVALLNGCLVAGACLLKVIPM